MREMAEVQEMVGVRRHHPRALLKPAAGGPLRVQLLGCCRGAPERFDRTTAVFREQARFSKGQGLALLEWTTRGQ